MAPELNAWTEMAARAYGAYAGINDAIKKARAADGSVAHHASEIRQQMIMMALIRSFAVMDRDARVSFQSVYRFLHTPNALNELAESYAKSEPASSVDSALATCAAAKTKFLVAYRAINFKSLGRMQSFRNSGIAHITMPDIEKARVTYTEIEKLVLSCCELAGQLTLMVSGRNDWPKEHLDDAFDVAYAFWLEAITAHSEGRIAL
ncbi:hypothetical protein [Mesorhizobium sp.]|uniref:hypothetical protein n=1 Tax=Mesorhizobium sp. TaxID=1871066 RepID=UPI000FEA4CD8|nr:hypothetical protein [Mesorhizobium sp.]RWO77159.1 MAG: hypothetical protein EOQ96_32230 [Mesorhizobium sp.]